MKKNRGNGVLKKRKTWADLVVQLRRRVPKRQGTSGEWSLSDPAASSCGHWDLVPAPLNFRLSQ